MTSVLLRPDLFTFKLLRLCPHALELMVRGVEGEKVVPNMTTFASKGMGSCLTWLQQHVHKWSIYTGTSFKKKTSFEDDTN